MKNKSFWINCLFLFLLASPANAQFAMSEMIIDFPDNSPRQHDVEIISKSSETQYIATETYIITNPSAPNEKRTLFTNPVKSGLLITPSKMVLPAQSRKMMRFLTLAPQTDHDQIYRIVVKPVIQGIDETKRRIALKVLVGYDALVIVRPKNAKIDLSGTRKGNSLTLTNNGNTNALIETAQQCDALGNNCKPVSISRIYAGRSGTAILPYENGVVKCRVWDGTTSTDMTF